MIPEPLDRLRTAPLQVVGRFPDASNLTLLAQTPDGLRCVYKPTAGERPLWDFPTGTLGRREEATYLLSRALGWALVPGTVMREDGPYGPGVCQRFIESGPGVAAAALVPAGEVPQGWIAVGQGEDEQGRPVALVHRDAPQLRRLALLDAVANNADRKGGHILLDPAGAFWGIDHGLTFHPADKLRSVVWGFAGDPIGDADLAALSELARTWDRTAAALRALLSAEEVDAAAERLDALLREGAFPVPLPGWPRLPWPPL